MTSESVVDPKANSRTHTAVEALLAATRKSAQAMEDEAATTTALERAYRKANAAAAELKSAARGEVTARAQLALAQKGEKQPLRNAEKAEGLAAEADRVAAQQLVRWKTEEDRLAEAHRGGKTMDRRRADKAKLKADDAGRKAKSAHAVADRAKGVSEAALGATREVQERTKQAGLRLRTARIEDARAKHEVQQAEEKARLAIVQAMMAQEAESAAKKTIDRAIGMLKVVMRAEARAAEIEAVQQETGRPQATRTKRRATESSGRATSKSGTSISHLFKRGRQRQTGQVQQLPVPAEAKTAAATVESGTLVRNTRPSLYSGKVRLFVPDPVDPKDLSTLRDRLGEVVGLRVMSTGGYSGEGNTITVAADQPLPLASQLDELDIVEKASKRGNDIEVRLRLPKAVS